MAGFIFMTLDEFFRPGTWPRKWRRWFLLTLPVSGPLYILVWMVIVLGVVVVCLTILPAMFAGDAVKRMWNEPDERPRRPT